MREPMKVVWLAPNIWPRELGGVELVVDILSRQMAQAGCEVEVWVSGLAAGYRQRTSDGRLLLGLGQPRVPAAFWPLTPLWRLAHGARQLWGRGQVDAIFSPAALLTCACLLAGPRAPVIYCPGGTVAGSYRYDLPPEPVRGLRGLLRSASTMAWQLRMAEHWALARSAGVIAVSARVKAQMLALRQGLERRIRIIYNGGDHQRLDPAPYEREAKRPGTLTAVTVARLHPIKNIEHLIRAWSLVRWPHRRLWIVGDGIQMEPLRALSACLGLMDSVHFLGARQDVRGLLDAADVFVLPSLYEACPLALLEAMAAGLPGITLASVPGISDVAASGELNIDGVTGFVVDPRDPADMARRLDQLAADGDLRRRLGQAAAQRVARQFTWAQTAHDYLAFARQLSSPPERADAVLGVWHSRPRLCSLREELHPDTAQPRAAVPHRSPRSLAHA